MERRFCPEGGLLDTEENRAYLASMKGLERAMNTGATVEGIALRCDERLCLHVELSGFHGVIEPAEAVWLRAGEERKDIAILTRVGKPVACKVTAIEVEDGELCVRLSRRAAQKECIESYLCEARAGDLLEARVTHMEQFGAFLDIGCGVTSLLPVDAISVSRITHPRERLACGMPLTVAVKSINRETERIYVTLKELLGTWEENARAFEVGQTVTGVIRSVESYGVFVELAPNLAGLSEVKPTDAEQLRERVGHSAAVYVKSITPERTKIKLVLIDPESTSVAGRTPLRYFIDRRKTSHLSYWRYTPESCSRLIETCFEEDATESL